MKWLGPSGFVYGVTFFWLKAQDGVIKMSPAQVSALFEGLNWRRGRPERVRRPELAGSLRQGIA